MYKTRLKIASILLSLVLTLSLFPYVPVYAAVVDRGYCGDGGITPEEGDSIIWQLDDEGKLTIDGNGDMFFFKEVQDSPWSGRDDIKTVIISEGVTSISRNSFTGCSNLDNITIPNSVNSIGTGAFEGCKSLKSITIPNSISTIEYMAFYLSGLENIDIPSSVTSIDQLAFDACTSLTSIVIPDNVNSIGDRAFSDCLKLDSLYISKDLYDLSASAFSGCPLTNLNTYNAVKFTTDGNGTAKVKERDYTTGVVELEFSAYENYALDKATYEDKDGNVVKIEPVNGVYSINTADDTLFDGDIPVNVYFKQVGGNCGKNGDNVKWSFDEATGTLTITGSGEMENWKNKPSVPWSNYWTQITSVIISDGVTSIGDSALAGIDFTSIVIPASITSIGKEAFGYCTSLTSVEIPASVTSIGNYAFYFCTSLTSVEIPEGVTSIGEEAFGYCESLTSVEIPASVTTIGKFAFASCTSLTSVEIPASVTSISDGAFDGCTSLTSIEIPASVTSIGFSAFSNCTSLKCIEIPASVTSIGISVFSGCTNLEKAVFLSDTPVGYDFDIFYDSGVKTVFCTNNFSNSDFAKHLVSDYHVPLQIINVYDLSYSDDGHGTISGKERSYESDVVEFSIDPYECYVLDKVVFTDNLGNTTELKSVDGKYTMPASEDMATVKAFFKVSASGTCGKNGGDNLKWSVDETGTLIISGTGEMDNWFDSDDLISSAPWGILQNEIKTVIIQDGVTSIGEYAFSYCHGIENVTIADSVTSLGEGAFKDCENLATVTLNKGLKEGCDKSVFENCNPDAKFIFYEYAITYAEATNGTVSGAAKACDTDKVGLSLTPAHNYAVESVTVTDKNKEVATLEPDTDGKYSFGMPRSEVTVTATFEQVKADVTFCSEDGQTILDKRAWDLNTKPSYSETPSKEPDAQYTYTFYGWTDGDNEYKPSELPAVTKDVTYKAVFRTSINEYKIRFQNESGTELQTLTLDYGEVPAYSGITPTKVPTQSQTFEFSGWTDGKNNYSLSDALPEVKGTATYTALFTGKAREYTIKFVNEDGTELQSGKVAYGVMPAYSGATPEKKADAQFTYTFKGWDKTIVSVTGDAVYKATYSSTVNGYTIKFVNEDGTELQSGKVAYGETPSYTGKTPTKEATDQYTYTFAGWTPEITMVTGDATYIATYSKTVNEYTIKFVNEDGTVLQSSKVAYDVMPSYTGETPTKKADAQYTYTFKGWDKTIAKVTGDATYTATYSTTVNEYTIKFVNEDGTVLQSSKVAYDVLPTYTGETPTKAATGQNTYTFSGWTPAITKVTGDATYTATYSSTVNEYTIKFVNEDGTVLQSGKVAYGVLPAYTGDAPTKAATAQYTYTFKGWTPAIVKVTGDATYTATYTSTVNEYTIKFVNEDGTVLQTSKVAYDVLPAYTGETPTKAATAQYTYKFSGWTPAITKVTGDATYTATYSSTVNDYTVKFVKEDGTEVASAKYPYGTKAADIELPEGPEKEADKQFTYVFAGWGEIKDVTGDATYKATYSTTVNEYTVKFVKEDGTEISSKTYVYGTTASSIEVPSAPEKEADQQYTYTFKEWYPAIATVTGDATYKATYSSTVNEYTIKFVNEDGTLLQSSKVAYGELPSYTGETPTKAATAQYTYTFAGWTPEIAKVRGDATYKATYTSTVNKYTIKFVDEDGTTVLQSSEVAYGETPSYTGATPAKKADAQYTYTFAGWTPEIAKVTGDATYKATYVATVNEYTIKFVDEDGTVLQSSKVAYGETPSYTGAAPSKKADAQYSYTFAGWTPEIAIVTGDATYKATYTATVNEYTIKFVDEDGTTVLQSSEFAYGETPSYTGATPTKKADAQYTYTFAGWTPEIAKVTGDATYKATYTRTVNEYTVKFINYDGSVLQVIKVSYGSVPAYTGATPVRPETDTSTFDFAGWSNGENIYTGTLPFVTGDATYTAVFTEVAKPDPTPGTYYLKRTYVDEQGNMYFEIERLGDEAHTIDYYDKAEGDGKKLEEGKDADIYSGSVIIKLRKEYVDTLSEGTHTLKVYFKDGVTLSVDFTITRNTDNKADIPSTGELIARTVFIGAGLIVLAGAIFGTVVLLNKRKKRAKDTSK